MTGLEPTDQDPWAEPPRRRRRPNSEWTRILRRVTLVLVVLSLLVRLFISLTSNGSSSVTFTIPSPMAICNNTGIGVPGVPGVPGSSGAGTNLPGIPGSSGAGNGCNTGVGVP